MPTRSSKDDTPENQQHAHQSTAKVAAESSSVRHVGRTLESDPEYNDQPARALAPAAALISRGGNDLTATPEMHDEYEQLERTHITGGTGQEPLRTRLPGDTSSDPHTDLAPDGATAAQNNKGPKK